MIKPITLMVTLFTICSTSYAQNKTLIGIVPFKSSAQKDSYGYSRSNNSSEYNTAIQDAVADAFLKTKRFSLVEREKMDQLKSEKNLQKDEDFIDGQVIEQSKSLGAQYVVLGNISKAKAETKQVSIPVVGMTTSNIAEIAFNTRVVDVATGEIMASNSFSATSKGKTAFEDALKEIKPQIEKFIKDNFKIVASIASIEEKSGAGEAVKVLISGGSGTGVSESNQFKVYEATELVVDGKKLTRKKQIGKIVVSKVEDENFSICTVTEGGADIAKKMEGNAKLKCEIINE
ncbi:CsgG/HfaB family protein [Chitinophaga niabensis]|uniref:Curli production assembly/transport component CsgG n=1 Tax=Chitinophaga niabensis TaxID=536979 RepID=A0A1N6K3A6_9BACT|nr:CsgG/HfaB family protein [Chitinophaga niabensis]SIO51049.1 Curli production assembly/transport component CsgG [Chitinophaga niabensis]